MYDLCGTTKTPFFPFGLVTSPCPCAAHSPAMTRATAVLPTPLLPVIIKCSPGASDNDRSRTSTSGEPVIAFEGTATSTCESATVSPLLSGSGRGFKECRVERSVYSRVVRPASSRRSLYAYMSRPPASARDRRRRLDEMYAISKESARA